MNSDLKASVTTYTRIITLQRAKQVAEYQLGGDPQSKRPVLLMPPGNLEMQLENLVEGTAQDVMDVVTDVLKEKATDQAWAKEVVKTIFAKLEMEPDLQLSEFDKKEPELAVAAPESQEPKHGEERHMSALWCSHCRRWVVADEPWFPHSKHASPDKVEGENS